MANGVLLHTPEWGSEPGGAPVGFELDSSRTSCKERMFMMPLLITILIITNHLN